MGKPTQPWTDQGSIALIRAAFSPDVSADPALISQNIVNEEPHTVSSLEPPVELESSWSSRAGVELELESWSRARAGVELESNCRAGETPCIRLWSPRSSRWETSTIRLKNFGKIQIQIHGSCSLFVNVLFFDWICINRRTKQYKM
jgi:hypothetical protein